MDLLEYQAKELFHEVGIPILPSQCIHDPRELKKLHIPYPVVLKSQVRVGGRGRAGGIRFVENTIDAIAAARAIFNLPILNQYPEVVLAEARYNATEEFFLAVVLDYQRQRPVLLGSARGGMDIEVLLENIQTVVVEDQFSPFYARRLAISMGLTGVAVDSISFIIQKMYHLFCDWDLDLVEINPLGISDQGEVMALDGKITLNDHALARHPEISELIKYHPESQDISLDQSESLQQSIFSDLEPQPLGWLDEKGNIGLLCCGLDSAITTWDLLIQNQGLPATGFLINRDFEPILPSAALKQIIEQALEKLKATKNLKVILVNILGHSDVTEMVAEAIARQFSPQVSETVSSDRLERPTATVSRNSRGRNKATVSKKKASPTQDLQWVIRLVGGDLQPIQEKLADFPLYWTENLEEAINQAIYSTKL
jgi:succinyl-CoA synthetase beta subunit